MEEWQNIWKYKIEKVYTFLAKRLIDNKFQFSKGGKTEIALEKFLSALEKIYGNITAERIVDFCVSSIYKQIDGGRKIPLSSVFTEKAVLKFKEYKRGKIYYEDKWLASENLSRDTLCKLIRERSQHPQSKYLYVASEEQTKKRLLNKPVGYMLCQSSTLGWSPLSDSCKVCGFESDCKNNTQKKYPELFRLRIEYEQK